MGRIIVNGVAQPENHPSEVPMTECGMSAYEVLSWFGLDWDVDVDELAVIDLWDGLAEYDGVDHTDDFISLRGVRAK